MQRLKIIVFFICILLPGAISNAVFESSTFRGGDSSMHFGLSYMALILMMFIGFIGWRAVNQIWVSKVWLLSYLFVFGVSVFVKLIQVLIYKIPVSLAVIFSKLDLLFISPLPFSVLYILSIIVKSKDFGDYRKVKS